MTRRPPPFKTVIIPSKCVPLIHEYKRVVAEQTGGRDRSSDKIDPDEASIEGAGSELVQRIEIHTQLHRSIDEAIEMWWETRYSGRNTGHDIISAPYGLDKDIEDKCTVYFTMERGYLYMRVASGDSWNVNKDYWASILPESYYNLLIYEKILGSMQYKFVGWATRSLLLKEYDNWLLYNLMPPGRPTIGIVWFRAYDPAAFWAIVHGTATPEKLQQYFDKVDECNERGFNNWVNSYGKWGKHIWTQNQLRWE